MAEEDVDYDFTTSGSVVVSGDVRVANVSAGEIVGNTIIQGSKNVVEVGPASKVGLIRGADIIAGEKLIRSSQIGEIFVTRKKEVLSSEQALGRIADAVRLNLGQVQLNMEQARRESSQFFRTTLIFSGVAFAIILGGIGLMLANLVTVGIVTTAASIIPEAGALLFFNKDRELRKTIETYHGYILDSQQVLTMVDVAETIEESSAKDAVKEQIILAVLKVRSTVSRDGNAGKHSKEIDKTKG